MARANTRSRSWVGTYGNINGKTQRAEQMKVHTMFVIGKRDMEANDISVRVHGKGNLGPKPRTQAVAEILDSIKARTP
jgi:threonyl-tRNA synthetase